MFKLKPSINVWALLFFYYSYATTALQTSSLEAQSGGGRKSELFGWKKALEAAIKRERNTNKQAFYSTQTRRSGLKAHGRGNRAHIWSRRARRSLAHGPLLRGFNRRSQASGFGFGVHMSHKTWNDFVGLPVSFDYLVPSTETTEATVTFNIRLWLSREFISARYKGCWFWGLFEVKATLQFREA